MYLWSAVSCIFCYKGERKKKSASCRRKEVTLLNRYMESDPPHTFTTNITCTTLDTRAMCVVCGAPAIGKN